MLHHARLALPLLAVGLVAAGCSPAARVVSTATPGATSPTPVPTPVKGGKTVPLGSFQVVSDELLAADPAYAKSLSDNAGLLARVTKVTKGEWKAEALMFTAAPKDERCAELLSFHVSHSHPGNCNWKSQEGVVGVDSGQAGVFDPKHAGDHSVVPKDYRWKDEMIDPDDRWYSLCCDFTLSAKGAGVIPYGAVASSGWGDGGYSCFTCESEAGRVQGLRLVFISQEDEQSQ